MSIRVELRIDTDHFELGHLIAQHEGLDAELERVVPTENIAIPYVWVTGAPEVLSALTETFRASEKTTTVSILDELTVSQSTDRMHLYRIEWILDELDIIRGLVDADGTILRGELAGDDWTLRFRFRTHDCVAEFYQFLVDNGLTEFSIDSISESKTRRDRESNALTLEQREALTLAAQRGYFDLPRNASLEQIGEELGITQQATSERVRRGVRNVVFDALNLPPQ